MDRGRREEGVGVWRVGSPRLVRQTPAGSLTLWRHTVDHRLPTITPHRHWTQWDHLTQLHPASPDPSGGLLGKDGKK